VSGVGVAPSRICLAPDGSLYILDIQHAMLQKLDRTGKRGAYVFTAANREEFLLERPSDLECAGGDVLVTDSTGGHVVVIDEDGRFVLLFAAQGPGKGQLSRPISITANAFGDIFVLDSAKEEIIEFDRGFRFRARHKCSLGGETGEVLADARSGSILVLDGKTGGVRRLDADGELSPVVSTATGRGSAVPAATSIALRSDGHMLVGTENASIWEYDREGVLRGILGEEDFGRVPDIAVSDDGQLFVLDASISQVDRFGRHGWLKGRFGAKGKYEGRFVKPARICVDGEGNCYVFDDGANTIQKFYATGVFAKALPIDEGVAGNLRDAVDIDVAANGDVYILDARRKAVFVVTREGELKRIVPLTSSDARQSKEIRKPRHISLDPEGYIYISDPSAYAVYRFHPDGTRINKLGGKGKEPGMFGKIADLETDGQGYVYVLLEDRRVVSKFKSDGRFITEIPLGIDNDNPSRTPECIAVDSYGALYAFDNYYKSVLKFMQ
jgi:DNA-binding beta-propeller fold protein YncE